MGVLSLSIIFLDYFKEVQKPLKSSIFIVVMSYNSYIHFWNITKRFSVYNITQQEAEENQISLNWKAVNDSFHNLVNKTDSELLAAPIQNI
jgi:hypothetical protein